MGIPASNTNSCVFPLVRYYLLCLNRWRTQADKSGLTQFFLWIGGSDTVSAKHARGGALGSQLEKCVCAIEPLRI
jgi:hypothetical protein